MHFKWISINVFQCLTMCVSVLPIFYICIYVYLSGYVFEFLWLKAFKPVCQWIHTTWCKFVCVYVSISVNDHVYLCMDRYFYKYACQNLSLYGQCGLIMALCISVWVYVYVLCPWMWIWLFTFDTCGLVATSDSLWLCIALHFSDSLFLNMSVYLN